MPTKPTYFVFKRVAYAALLFLPLTPSLMASTTGLPWEGPLQTLADSLTGPVAVAISLIAMVVCGGLLIFNNEEMGAFAKKMIMIVLILAGFFLGGNLLLVLFGFTASVI